MSHLTDAAAFFDKLRHSDLLGPDLSRGEVDGTNSITTAAGVAGWGLSWTAYALATAFHETAGKMVPVSEIGGEAYFRRKYDIEGLNPRLAQRLGNIRPGDGARYSGRGQVQLTGRANYFKAGEALGLPLIEEPGFALTPQHSARIMVWGMEGGHFTGVSLASYLPKGALAGTRAQFSQARHIINGSDRADMVAGYALLFQDALSLGGWTVS